MKDLKLLKRKKGDLPDMLIFMITVFILAIGFFIFAFIIPEITDGLSEAGLNESQEGFDAIQAVEEIGTVTIQRGFFFLFVGLIISVMITSFLSSTHPIFFFMYILFLAVTIFVATYLGNAYTQLTSNPIFAERMADQTLINVVMDNIILITLAVGALSFIIIFAKFRSSPGGGGGGAL